jgi:serine/threonine protein kinase
MNDDSLLGQLAEEFTSRIREGKPPVIEEYVNRHPQLAGRIRELFPTLMLLEGIAATGGSASTQAMLSPLSADSVFGSYHIKREIGRGGMGIVYEAVHVLLEKRVALKMLPVRTLAGADQLERFFREARMAAGLRHTNIVPVFDVGQVAGTPYYTMQYIEGSGLDQTLRIMQTTGSGRVDQSARIQAGLPGRFEDYFRWVSVIGIQAAEGLAYAHERKIIHRDIKPSNLLLDKEGVLWIADFGLARKIEDPVMTQSGTMLGTPRYMSPEQAESARRPVDQRSDIYSLGATLYELLTYRPVFDGKTPQEVLSQIITREPVAPRRLNPEIPADLAVIVMKAMAKRPEDRYQAARELADDLNCWQKMEPIKARPIGLLGRTIRWCRRNPRIPAMLKSTAEILIFFPEIYLIKKIRYRKTHQKIRSPFTRAELIAAISLAAAVIIIALTGFFIISLNEQNQDIAALQAVLRDGTEPDLQEYLSRIPVRDWPYELSESSWKVVKSPGATEQAYTIALRQAEIASRINPEFLDTLAAAQYRLGKYADVVRTTTISDERRRGPSIPSTAFRAMAQFKLGDIAKARASLAELRKTVKQQRASKNILVQEAESLLGSR